ncbi:MAG TPA: sulfite exporter TauE/SafE family protein [Candidatus Binatia bacterium]|nr:sulfite exporter TauE/SafE family protein [Candidatus Binatia bacterium]
MDLALVAIGLVVGAISGMVGVGGGILLVPALVYLLRFSQHEAQGTSLAVLVPPIGIFAALEYYRQGYVRLPVVGWVAVGFAGGALAGALIAGQLSGTALRRGLGVLLFFIALQMLFSEERARFQAVLPIAIATGAAGALAWVEHRFGFGRRARRRLVHWIRRNRPPRPLGGDIEYHI